MASKKKAIPKPTAPVESPPPAPAVLLETPKAHVLRLVVGTAVSMGTAPDYGADPFAKEGSGPPVQAIVRGASGKRVTVQVPPPLGKFETAWLDDEDGKPVAFRVTSRDYETRQVFLMAAKPALCHIFATT